MCGWVPGHVHTCPAAAFPSSISALVLAVPAPSALLADSSCCEEFTSSVSAEYCRPPRTLPPVLITTSLSAEPARCTRELSTTSASIGSRVADALWKHTALSYSLAAQAAAERLDHKSRQKCAAARKRNSLCYARCSQVHRIT